MRSPPELRRTYRRKCPHPPARLKLRGIGRSKIADVGIRISDFKNGRRLSPSLVAGYDLSEAGTAEPFRADWDVLGASSVWISVHDLARWGEGLLSDPAQFTGYSRIGALRSPEEDKSRGYAAGLMTMSLEGDSVVYHLGGTEGFSSGMFLWPRRNSVLAFSCNRSPDLIIRRGLESEARDMFVQFQELVFLHARAADQRSYAELGIRNTRLGDGFGPQVSHSKTGKTCQATRLSRYGG